MVAVSLVVVGPVRNYFHMHFLRFNTSLNTNLFTEPVLVHI